LRPSLSDAKATPAVAFCFFANHVLDGAPWACERLARFAGKRLEFRALLLPSVLVGITAQGRLEPASAAPAAAVVLLAPGVRISGDDALVAELEELARTLRWDVEEDLSRIFGDVLAHRAAQAGQALWRWQNDAAGRIGEALAAYAGDEARLVVRRPELAAFAASLARLARELGELEQRVARLD
jgi:ubiquinone biosynthesis protein UbiJ